MLLPLTRILAALMVGPRASDGHTNAVSLTRKNVRVCRIPCCVQSNTRKPTLTFIEPRTMATRRWCPLNKLNKSPHIYEKQYIKGRLSIEGAERPEDVQHQGHGTTRPPHGAIVGIAWRAHHQDRGLSHTQYAIRLRGRTRLEHEGRGQFPLCE